MGGGTAFAARPGCVVPEPWWRRVGRAALRRSDRIALILIGVLVVIVPAVVPWLADLRTEVLALGVGLLVLGVVLPSVAEAEVGLQGLRYKRVVAQRDAEFAHELSEAETDELVRLAMHLGVERGQATEFVSDACVRAYGEWHLVRHRQPRLVVVCHLVRQVVRADALGLLTVTSRGAGGSPLSDLDLRTRALLLLHVYEGYDKTQVARILGEPVARIQQELIDALTVLESDPDRSTVDPT